jgi:hypothetical protein
VRAPSDEKSEPPAKEAHPAVADRLANARPETIQKLISEAVVSEEDVCLLLQHADLPAAALEEIARRRDLLDSYKAKRALVFHPHARRVTAARFLRDLHLMDLVKLTRAPATPADLRRAVEEQLMQSFAQVALGQKIAVARQASARVAAALIAEGNPRVVEAALGNPLLTEAQILKLLAKEKLPAAVILSLARHERWSSFPNVRLALLRHPQTPLESALRILPNISPGDLRALRKSKSLPSALRRQIDHECLRRFARETR